MQGRCRIATPGLVIVLSALTGASPGSQAAPSRTPSAAYRVIELPSGRTLSSSREDLLRTPVLPGSILKIALLIAASETSVIGPDTRMLCPRRLDIDGRRFTCSHPDLGRPMGPAEALAHSCNAYFALVASRVRRDALDRALAQLGLPPTSPTVPIVAAALGLEGTRVSADQLLTAFATVATGRLRVRDQTRRLLLDGLRGAADYGTAGVFRERGVTALAKTGTAPMPGGGDEGLVVAAVPADRPTRAIVLMAPGSAGFDAARRAADVLAATEAPAPRARPGERTVRVGRARRDGGYDIETIALEEYVARVVTAEAAPSSPLEARKALAVVARTYALANLSRHGREGFDLCDLTHCQVMGARSAAGDEAASATDGQVLVASGRPATVFYTASCGGHSERPSAVWPGAEDPPYLPSTEEAECRAESRWQREIPEADLRRALAASGRHGQVVRRVAITGRSASGRVTRLRVDGVEPADISGEEFRLAVGRTLGWQVLASTLFDVERTAAGYRFRGSGRGHGVGLCVVGSARLAAAGQAAPAILARYFPGTSLRRTTSAPEPPPPARLDITVPAGEERERSRIETVAGSALRTFSSMLGVPCPPVVRIVVQPTVEAYARATGQPWWTSGAARGTRIDLVPASVLRQRGILDETLRHELAHVVTGARLSGRPIWVREAVATKLAAGARLVGPPPARAAAASDGSTAAPGPAPSCPTDGEWRSLRSADAMRHAYRLASACFDAQRAAGRAWDEVR
jgi:stage II sporulation protein D (peptidoglycan lytic transglycosylase)